MRHEDASQTASNPGGGDRVPHFGGEVDEAAFLLRPELKDLPIGLHLFVVAKLTLV
ncbi:MAG: hypothetical protein ABSA18_11565 [Dehalococcoidia bacterium]